MTNATATRRMNEAEADQAMTLAIGRLFRMGARPTEPGDVEMYYKLRDVVFEAADVLGLTHDRMPHTLRAYAPNWAAQRNAGAAGD